MVPAMSGVPSSSGYEASWRQMARLRVSQGLVKRDPLSAEPSAHSQVTAQVPSQICRWQVRLGGEIRRAVAARSGAG